MVTVVLPFEEMIEIRTYIDRKGGSPYTKWFNRLNAPAAAKVVTALVRMEQGNLSNTKSVGSGVFESRIDFGPGYRVYFGKDGDTLIILLGGGTKKRQQKDIQDARTIWKEYKRRKKQEG
jgi:putative addiction module killer protein